MKVVNMRTNNWHGRTIVTDNHKFFTGDEWESIQNLSGNSLRMPEKINFQLESTDEIEGIKLNYEFGKSVGHSLLRNKMGDIELLEEVYNSNYILPSKFFNLNKDYVRGIYDVMSKNKIMNTHLNELFYWCSFVLKRSLMIFK